MPPNSIRTQSIFHNLNQYKQNSTKDLRREVTSLGAKETYVTIRVDTNHELTDKNESHSN